MLAHSLSRAIYTACLQSCLAYTVLGLLAREALVYQLVDEPIAREGCVLKVAL